MTNNPHITETQKDSINKWDGSKILLLMPNGSSCERTFSSQESDKFNAGEFESAMIKLDDFGAPRSIIDAKGQQELSIVGRIMWLIDHKDSIKHK